MIKGRNLLFSAGLVIAVLSLTYFWWVKADRSYAAFEMTSERSVFVKAGTYNKGNIVGIQPYMVPSDYRTADALYAKLNRYLSIAKKNGCFTPATVVVFPEYIGTWLVAINEKASVYTTKLSMEAMTTVAYCHPLSFLQGYLSSDQADKLTASLFKLKSQEMASAYQTVFSRLAREYNATIVAGSIVLPTPEIVNGVIQVDGGPLHNVSAIFDPSGELVKPLMIKKHLIDEEKTFTQTTTTEQIDMYTTTAGSMGALICADSWYSDSYEAVAQADFVVVPSFLAGNEVWNQPWNGYNGDPAPANVSTNDIGTLTEGQAWQKYGMLGRAPEFGIKTGLNIFLRGQLWDLGTNGHPLILSDGQAEMIEIPADGAAIVNLQF